MVGTGGRKPSTGSKKQSQKTPSCSTTSSNPPSLNCSKCTNEFEESDESIECWQCKHWLHRKCTSLSPVEFDNLARTKNSGIQWICSSCLDLTNTQSSNNNIAELKTLMLTMQTTINNLVCKISLLEEERRDTKKSIESMVQKEVSLAIDEMREEDKRKNNVIISGLVETPDTDETKNLLEATHLLTDIPNVKDEICSIFRLGKPPTAPNSNQHVRPRLLKVSFKSLETKEKVFRKLIDINKREKDPKKKIYVNDDLTSKQRIVDKEVREELKRRRSLGEDVVRRGNEVILRNPPSSSPSH